ncbi:MAG: APC family permease [Terrimesophilobacter sp.]
MSSSASDVAAPGLKRKLSVTGVVSITISDITPMASLLIIAPVVLGLAGTASVWAYLIGGFIAICAALCMAELGSMHPAAGGLYSIVHKVLGRPIGFVALIDYIFQGIFLPASIALGLGTYLHALNPAIPVNLSSAIGMAVVTVLALLRINVGAILIGIFLAIEVAVLVLLATVGLTHWTQPLTILTDPVVASGTSLETVAAGAVIAALATAMFSINGYDSAINFSEETRGGPRVIGRAVVISALVAIVLEVVPFVAGLFGAGDLHAYLSSPTPLTDLVHDTWGPVAANIIIVGALFAIVNALLAITLQFARILWSSGRDKAWPAPVNRLLGRIHPTFHSPWVATLLIGAVATGLCFASDLVTTVTFTAVLIIILYGIIAVAALVSRVRDKERRRPYRMPLWPIPPIITILGVGIALTQQTLRDMVIIVIIVVAALAYYFLYLHRARGDRWISHTPIPEELDEIDP